MSNLDEQNGMHEADITWSAYKQLVINNEVEQDKIYFIEDLTNQAESLEDLLTTMNQLKTLIESHN